VNGTLTSVIGELLDTTTTDNVFSTSTRDIEYDSLGRNSRVEEETLTDFDQNGIINPGAAGSGDTRRLEITDSYLYDNFGRPSQFRKQVTEESAKRRRAVSLIDSGTNAPIDLSQGYKIFDRQELAQLLRGDISSMTIFDVNNQNPITIEALFTDEPTLTPIISFSEAFRSQITYNPLDDLNGYVEDKKFKFDDDLDGVLNPDFEPYTQRETLTEQTNDHLGRVEKSTTITEKLGTTTYNNLTGLSDPSVRFEDLSPEDLLIILNGGVTGGGVSGIFSPATTTVNEKSTRTRNNRYLNTLDQPEAFSEISLTDNDVFGTESFTFNRILEPIEKQELSSVVASRSTGTATYNVVTRIDASDGNKYALSDLTLDEAKG
jgi:hypothetical protein